MALRHRRIVSQPSAEELSSSPSETSSKSPSEGDDEYQTVDYSTKADIAKENHDVFNLFALVLVVAASLINWDLTSIHLGPNAAYKGNFFYTNLLTTMCYFVVDLLWVALIPISVKSPGTIIKHHFVAIIYLSGPALWPEYRWFLGACLSVEINTWFLILRRVLFKRKANLLLQQIVSGGFYLSWIAIRVILYPLIMYLFCCMARDRIEETGIFFHWPMIFMPLHFFLCVLNLKWTYDLFMPMIKDCFGTTAQKGHKISSGL